MGAGRVGRPQDRADVVRILDTVENDNQRRTRGFANQISNRIQWGIPQLGHRPLMRTPARCPIKRGHIDALHGNPARGGQPQNLTQSLVTSAADTK
jgi:hypothetical protein